MNIIRSIKEVAGRFTSYLRKPGRYRQCDPPLFDTLRNIVVDRRLRCVAEVRRSRLFPGNARFYERPLTFKGINANSSAGRERRRVLRDNWLRAALGKVRRAALVFLDPDNGLECPSVGPHVKDGPKYAFYDEVDKFANGVSCLVVYHHLCRHKKHGSHEEQVRRRRSELRKCLLQGTEVLSLVFRPFSARAFFVIFCKENSLHVDCVLERFMNGAWGQLRLSSDGERAWRRID